MALRPQDILGITAQGGTPLDSFFGGMGSVRDLERMRLQNEALEQQIATATAQAPLKQRDMEQRIALQQADLDLLGVPDAPTAQQMALTAVKISGLPDIDSKLAAIEAAKSQAVAAGRTTHNLDELEQAYLAGEDQGDQLLGAGINAFQQAGIIGGSGLSAEQRGFEDLISGFTPEEQERARKIKAGISPRAVGSADITTATTPGLTEKVGESEADIQQQVEFAKKTGASRAKAIDDGFDRITKIDTNVRNIDRAISAIDKGASTGTIESRFFPSFRQATKELDQVQKELGLDVIGSVTFGALSKGELQLALETALPTGMEPQDLKAFLQSKREAQSKLREYYSQQVDFLDQGGTIAGFLRQQNRQQQTSIDDLVNKYAN